MFFFIAFYASLFLLFPTSRLLYLSILSSPSSSFLFSFLSYFSPLFLPSFCILAYIKTNYQNKLNTKEDKEDEEGVERKKTAKDALFPPHTHTHTRTHFLSFGQGREVGRGGEVRGMAMKTLPPSLPPCLPCGAGLLSSSRR